VCNDCNLQLGLKHCNSQLKITACVHLSRNIIVATKPATRLPGTSGEKIYYDFRLTKQDFWMHFSSCIQESWDYIELLLIKRGWINFVTSLNISVGLICLLYEDAYMTSREKFADKSSFLYRLLIVWLKSLDLDECHYAHVQQTLSHFKVEDMQQTLLFEVLLSSWLTS
jgi:hypothetical protein